MSQKYRVKLPETFILTGVLFLLLFHFDYFLVFLKDFYFLACNDVLKNRTFENH